MKWIPWIMTCIMEVYKYLVGLYGAKAGVRAHVGFMYDVMTLTLMYINSSGYA